MNREKINKRYSDGHVEAVSAENKEWIIGCNRAVNNEYFNSFRREPIFKQVIEGTSFFGGLTNLKTIIKKKYFLKTLPKIIKSDLYGCPENLIKFIINTKQYYLSPTTIRYTKNSLNLLNFFSKEIFNSNIYEIGGGYGGEAKIFFDFASIYNKGKKIKWNIFDLPSSYNLIKKFLKIFNYTTTILSVDKKIVIPKNSLAISCGALSEMRGNLLKKYIDKVVLPCKYGYFLTNFESHSKPFGGMSTKEFINYLKMNGKTDVIELDARIYLSYFDYIANSKLIVFGITNKNFKPISFSVLDYFKVNLIPKLIYDMSRLNQKFIKFYLK